jgi:hypothetical protein
MNKYIGLFNSIFSMLSLTFLIFYYRSKLERLLHSEKFLYTTNVLISAYADICMQ